jgi:actin-related protein
MEPTSPSVATEATIAVVTVESDVKLPKNCKENRYYYKHREEILERRRQKKMADPEYQAKQKVKEEAKEAKQRIKEEEKKRRELRKKAVEQLLNPVLTSSGVI